MFIEKSVLNIVSENKRSIVNINSFSCTEKNYSDLHGTFYITFY